VIDNLAYQPGASTPPPHTPPPPPHFFMEFIQLILSADFYRLVSTYILHVSEAGA